MAKQELPEPVKAFIVQALARFETPSAVARAVKQEFGLVVSRQAVEGYNPMRQAGRGLQDKWRSLFEQTRKAFLERGEDIGISHKLVRLHRLETLYWRAVERGDDGKALEILEQAAKEDGGLFTNARVLTGDLKVSAPRTLADFYAEHASHNGEVAAGFYADTRREGSVQ